MATLVACGSKPPEEDLLKKVQPVGSWLATLEMLGQKWMANSVPASFVKTTTSAARDQLTKAAEEAAKSPARAEVRDPFRALPVAILLWLFLWRSTFNTIENSTSLLGLITVAFVVAAVLHHPPVQDVLAGLVPSSPEKEPLKYWAIAVSIMGAVLSPYLFYFYSSGAVEDNWDASYVGVNRWIALIGMSFGSLVSMGGIVVAAMVLAPRGIEVNDYHEAAMMLTDAFPFWGFLLFALGLGIACLAGSLEVALSMAYAAAQRFGWNWGEDLDPREDARFCLVYTGAILLSSLVILIGVDPLKLTIFSMAVEAAVLPFVALPFVLLMNDRKLLKEHSNGWISNTVAVIVLLLSLVLMVVSIPLSFLGGAG